MKQFLQRLSLLLALVGVLSFGASASTGIIILNDAPTSVVKKDTKVKKSNEGKLRIKTTLKKNFKKDTKINKIILAVVCWFLGFLGIHRFLIGKIGTGIAQLLMFLVGFLLTITIIGALIGIPILIGLFIWVLIDFIRILLGLLG